MVFAISIVKDEADIVEHTFRHILTQVDHVIVADNGSTDGTREILEQLDVTLIDDPEIGYYQSRKMSKLAARAAARGATWVVPMDADEWWYSPFGTIKDVLSGRPDIAFAPAELYDHVSTRADPAEGPVTHRIGWRRREPGALPKMAARACLPVTILQGNHGAEYPAQTLGEQLVVRHFPYRSVEQFVRKVRNGSAAYAATNLPEHEGQHWRDYGALLQSGGEDAIREVFETWFHSADPGNDSGLVYDPVTNL